MSPARTFIYALGGGLGHASRGLALGRRLVDRQPRMQVRLLVNTPFAAAIEGEFARYPWLTPRILPPTATAAEALAAVEGELSAWLPETLVVDSFPLGIAGELRALLPRLRLVHKVLVARALAPAPELAAWRDFARAWYDEILLAGEWTPFDDLPQAQAAGALILCRPEELLPSREAALALGLSAAERCVLLVGSGNQHECRALLAAARRLAADWPANWPPLRVALPPECELQTDAFSREAALFAAEVIAAVRKKAAETFAPPAAPSAQPRWAEVRRFPLAPCLPAAMLVVGACGYHLWQEVRLAGVSALWLPQPRKYDPQTERAAGTLALPGSWGE